MSAGGLNVHDVQAPEAAHKVNMHLPSARVRHLSTNETQASMLKYMCSYTLFEELKHHQGCNRDQLTVRTKRPGLGKPFAVRHFSGATPVRLSERVKHTFLGPQVRVTVSEFLDMLRMVIGVPSDDATFRRLQRQQITFSESYVREDGLTLFGQDARRDIVSLKGLHEGNHLCCEIVCFVYIQDRGTYVLVRWLEPHSRAWERDVDRRPVCPGPLHVNNCLWRYALLDSPRDSLMMGRFFNPQRHIFGKTRIEQDQCKQRESLAYYGLITPECIVKKENMCPLFQPDTDSHDYTSLLQSVVIL